MAETDTTQPQPQQQQQQQRAVRLDIYVKRHPSLSSDEFHKKWSHVHGALVKGWLADKGVIRYTQYHTPPEISEQALGVNETNIGAQILDFDGHAEVVMPDLGVLKRLLHDNFFAAFAAPDQEAITDMTSIMRRVGYEEIWVKDGKAVDGPLDRI